MAEVLPTHSQMGMEMGRNNGTSAPLPNPPFVFPIQPEAANEVTSHARSLSNMDTAGSRRSAPRSRPQRLSINALPAFDFSPAIPTPTNLSPSPSRSPTRRTPPAHHSTGHRRNGSEFKGDTTTGAQVLGGTNSTEGERNSKPVSDTQLGPPITRRGHAHRRSGAISSHDLTMILKPPTEAKAGSAPTTPSDPMFQRTLPPEFDRSMSQPVLTTAAQVSSISPVQIDNPGADGQPRPRARFSEVLEYIPRPLSTISSETSSSMSTIRANHSVTNSSSSVVSSSPPSNTYQSIRRGQTFQNLDQDLPGSRPRTAEPLSRPSSGDWEWNLSDSETKTKRPSSAPGDSPSKGKAASDVLLARENLIPTNRSHGEFSSQSTLSMAQPLQTTLSSRYSNSQFSRRRPNPSMGSPTARPRTSPEPKVTKRQRKGRSWAGLLTRKGKQQELKEELVTRRSPTPPLRQRSPEVELSLDEINFDEDTTYIIETGSPYASKSTKMDTDFGSWKPRESSPLSESDGASSIIDIDAALESFDTPSLGPSFEDVVGGVGCLANKRRMHSSGVTGGFAGPGMHYHRRAESAPEMDAIDRSRFGFPRLGSNPAMAIEEEEEEEEEEEDEGKGHPAHADVVARMIRDEAQEDPAPGLGVNIVEADTIDDQPIRRARRRPVKNTIEDYAPSAWNLRQDPCEQLSEVEIVEADEEPRFSVITKSSDESTITPTLSHDPLNTHSTSAPVDFVLPTPALTYGTPETPSVISSPDFTKTSFDEAPRMHTATSSITDRATLSSSRAGDQGLGLHSSVDDVPSLTSSASIMSAHPTRFSSSANSAADRSSSLSAAVPARTRSVSAHKRLSLASLSRLTGGSYNRSKLNIEESAPVETVERTEKKKGNRISRMMKFWKSKEKLLSS